MLESERNEPKRHWLKASVGCLASIAFVVISIWFCSSRLVWALDKALDKAFEPPPEFCTVDDEIYQTIVLNGREWIETFRLRDWRELGSGSMLVSMPSREIKSVIAAWDWENKNEVPQLRIVVDTFRDILREYRYSPDKPIQYPDKDKYKYLANGVYCFDYTGRSFSER